MSHDPAVPAPAHSQSAAAPFGQVPAPARGTAAKRLPRFEPDTFRAVVWLIVAVTAVIVWFAAPSGEDAENWVSQVSAADARKTINDASAEGAPQQQVVNGWYVADVLPILSDQNSALHSTLTVGRIPSLMLVFGLGYCVDVVGSSFGRARLRRRQSGTPAEGLQS